MRRLVPIALVLLPALALSQEGYRPLGEIQSASSSASFDASSVRGPRVQMTREDDGRWTGRLLGMVIDGQERHNGVRGANFALYTERVKGGIAVRGNLDTRTVSLYISDDEAQRFQRRWTLKGLADAKEPPPVQFALAAVAALN